MFVSLSRLTWFLILLKDHEETLQLADCEDRKWTQSEVLAREFGLLFGCPNTTYCTREGCTYASADLQPGQKRVRLLCRYPTDKACEELSCRYGDQSCSVTRWAATLRKSFFPQSLLLHECQHCCSDPDPSFLWSACSLTGELTTSWGTSVAACSFVKLWVSPSSAFCCCGHQLQATELSSCESPSKDSMRMHCGVKPTSASLHLMLLLMLSVVLVCYLILWLWMAQTTWRLCEEPFPCNNSKIY